RRSSAKIMEKDGVVTSAPLSPAAAHAMAFAPTMTAYASPLMQEVSQKTQRMFPPSPAPEGTVEPSNVIVAKDLTPEQDVLLPAGLLRPRRQVAWIVAACVGVAALGGGLAIKGRRAKHPRAAAHVVEVAAPPATAVVVEPPAPAKTEEPAPPAPAP